MKFFKLLFYSSLLTVLVLLNGCTDNQENADSQDTPQKTMSLEFAIDFSYLSNSEVSLKNAIGTYDEVTIVLFICLHTILAFPVFLLYNNVIEIRI